MYLKALIGWMLIGTAALLFSGGVGRVMGVSGILKGILPKTEAHGLWRYTFLFGLMFGVLVYQLMYPNSQLVLISDAYWVYILAGILVGIGASLANGCTSGHAVCGIGRLSVRSLIATITFMMAAFATVLITQHIL